MAALFAVTVGLLWASSWFGLGPWYQQANGSQAAIDAFGSIGWYGVGLTLVLAFPYYAVSIKRRHDRGSSGHDVTVYLVLLVAQVLWRATQLGFTPAEVGSPSAPQNGFSSFIIWMPQPPSAYSAYSVLLGVYALYLVAVLGFTDGTRGVNRYGDGMAPARGK